ncbi:ImmA/IrrE family metallo-endopeptidase [Fusobacterium hwasookii]|uniref:ImmA/IrrE family metallo-endopeptidase n=1 Tax=Fusobacterium hwasookii TaxID=1583098 RepID=UPI0028E9A834|nr:ImmA/IrrE family metallo-endopeptidase [Fusobacterium hwasookii]
MKKMTNKRKKEILKLIDNLYFEFGTKNPLRLCKGLGIEIVSANIEMKGLYTEIFSSKLIIIQNLLEDFAKLFVIAHELFHALEHNCEQIRFFRECTSFKTNIYEEEANYFATHLLKDSIPFHQDEFVDLEVAEELEKYLKI